MRNIGNETRRPVPDLFLFVIKAFYEVKWSAPYF